MSQINDEMDGTISIPDHAQVTDTGLYYNPQVFSLITQKLQSVQMSDAIRSQITRGLAILERKGTAISPQTMQSLSSMETILNSTTGSSVFQGFEMTLLTILRNEGID